MDGHERSVGSLPASPDDRLDSWKEIATYLEGNFAAAVEPYRRMFEMDPGNPMARLFYIWVLIFNRRTEAIGAILETFPREVRDTAPGRLAFFLAHALAGHADEAHATVTRDIEAVAATTDVFGRMLAPRYALAGVPQRALHWLEMAIGRGFINYPFLARYDPFFQTLRTHPRFVQLMEIARDRGERFEA